MLQLQMDQDEMEETLNEQKLLCANIYLIYYCKCVSGGFAPHVILPYDMLSRIIF